MNVIGYIRVSTEDQNLSPEAQKLVLVKFCETNSYTLVKVYEDIGLSGSLGPADRPMLMAALEDLKKYDNPALLVAKRDRLARSVMVAAMLEQIVVKLGAKILSAEGNNGEGPDDFLIRGIKDLFAEYERLQIRLRTKAALAIKKARGERVGQIPYGFESYDVGDTAMVRENVEEQKVLKTILKMHSEGYSLNKITDTLNSHGIAARGQKWYTTSIQRLVRRNK
jgi:DNA invertase Pin-like site-specific DNA recombinase